MNWDQMITVGRVVRPQGNRGEVVVSSETDFGEDRFRPGTGLWITRAGACQELTVATSREHAGRWVIGFVGVGTIDDAERLRGAELRVAAEDIRPLKAGTFYVHDLVGCRVETTAGSAVGTVAGVQFGTGTPLLVVEAKTGEVLVPLAEAICRRVDIGGKRVVVDAIDGLLELNETGKRR
jgi:16S rRNA processing protein RimM